MAVNNNPYFTPGQALTPEQLALMLALQGDFAQNPDALQEYQTGYGDSTSFASAPQGTLQQSWALPGQGRFAPTLEYVPAAYKQQFVQNGDSPYYVPTDEVETPAYYRIRQGENDSFTRASHSHTWDPTTGQYLGRESSAGLWSSMAPVAAMALAAYGGSLAAGSSAAGGGAAASGAGATGAGTGGLNWGAIGSAAAKNAAINAGMTLAQGGDLGDALKSGAIGAVTGGAGGAMAGYGVNPMLAQAATGATGAALRGGDGSDILRGAAGGAVSGGIGQLGQSQGWSPETTAAARGAAGAAIGGGDGRDILRGAATGYAGSALNSGAQQQANTGAGDMVDYFSNTFGDGSGWSDNVFGDSFGNTPIDASSYWGLDPSIYDLGGYDSPQGGGIDWGSLLGRGAGWLMQGGGKDGKGTSPLAMLLGGLLGAQSGKDQKQTASRDPWVPMQPYLLGLAEDGRGLYQQYRNQPFSGAQQAAYSNVGGLLDNLNRAGPGLLQALQHNAGGHNQFVRGRQNRAPVYELPQWAFNPAQLGNFGTLG